MNFNPLIKMSKFQGHLEYTKYKIYIVAKCNTNNQ